jgi:predicted nuclease of predicted toxin-antitoxin system
MRFLLDENIPFDLAVALRREGHDVLWTPESTLRAASDDVLWDRAVHDDRIFVTEDLDFPLPPPYPPAMILLRTAGRLSATAAKDIVLEALSSLGTGILGELVVITPGRIRRRKL